jgi:hypothetical protein
MRSPPELRRNPLASRDSGGHQAKQGEEVNRRRHLHACPRKLILGRTLIEREDGTVAQIVVAAETRHAVEDAGAPDGQISVGGLAVGL